MLEEPHLSGSDGVDNAYQRNSPGSAYSRAARAERAYLHSLITASDKITASVFDVPISDGMHIHTLKVAPRKSDCSTLRGKACKVPIVLVHGFTGALAFWRDLAKTLALEGHTVYAIDMLGWGLSSRPHTFANWEWTQRMGGKRKTVENVAAFWVSSLADWREGVGITNFHIVGHSLGGWVAGEFALAYPQHIAKLTLANSVGVYPTDCTWFCGGAGWFMEATRTVFGVNWPFALVRTLDSLTFQSMSFSGATQDMVDQNQSAEDRQKEQKKMIDYIRAYMHLPSSGEIAAEYIRRRAHTEDGHVLWGRLNQIRFPVSLVYGEQDHIVPPYSAGILEQLSNAEQVDVNLVGLGAGHGTPTSADSKIRSTFAAIVLGDQALDDHKKEHPESIKLSLRQIKAKL